MGFWTRRLMTITVAATFVLSAHAVAAVTPAAGAAAVIAYTYGVNYPYGVGAVDYAYSADGMWKDLTNLQYGPNYYNDDEFLTPGPTPIHSPGHPYNRDELVRLAGDPDARYTARDKNGHLLHDFDQDGNLDLPSGGFAFHENNGKGLDGLPPSPTQRPFHNFFFDDNWLARHMAQAYGRTEPNGLSDDGDYIRWRVLSGDTNWTPYDRVPNIGSDDVDRLALDGLYYLSAGQPTTAVSKWSRIRTKVGTSWNATTRLYVYPGMAENYHVGMFKLLTDQLIAHHTGLSGVDQRELALHSVSLRAMIIKNQQRVDGTRLAGWTTSVNHDPLRPSLMNIETLAVNSLALGAGARRVYSPGQAPLQTHAANNYNLTPEGLLQAIPGTSTVGHMTFGPNHTFAPGSYNVEFVLRSINPLATSRVANLDVYDASSNTVLRERTVSASDFLTGNTYDRFIRFSVPITVSSATNSLEFRVWWYGANRLDIAEIRVR
jgi:hypothetical protein